jgi:hypothetical protein
MDKKRQLRELQQLEYNLNSKYNQSQFFKRLYEKTNKNDEKNDKKENCIIISTGSGRNIFSGISEDTVEILDKNGHFDKNIFDNSRGLISIDNYWDILETINYLIDIIQLDLTKAYVESDMYELIED